MYEKEKFWSDFSSITFKNEEAASKSYLNMINRVNRTIAKTK